MRWPDPVEKLWLALEAVRTEVLNEVERLSDAQAAWRPADNEWSVGEILHHITLAEVNTGKLTTKLTREAEAAGTAKPFPTDLRELAPLQAAAGAERADAPQQVWPERGKPIGGLIADMKAVHERSRQSMDRLAAMDPRPLVFKHFRFGPLDLSQWWRLQAEHEAMHLRQIREVKSSPGFPGA
jgi:uncharacterized damage-inducible protein DinB